MFKLVILLSLWFLAGCGRPGNYIDPRLETHVQKFEELFGITVTSDITISKIEKHVGLCKYKNFENSIIIDSDFYETHKSNYYAIQQLMFHELGHCELYMDHDDRTFSNGTPMSIMNYYAFGMFSYYETNNEYYLNELINK